MYCSKCGTRVAEDAVFCHRCGNKIEIGVDIDESDVKGCVEQAVSISIEKDIAVINDNEVVEKMEPRTTFGNSENYSTKLTEEEGKKLTIASIMLLISSVIFLWCASVTNIFTEINNNFENQDSVEKNDEETSITLTSRVSKVVLTDSYESCYIAVSGVSIEELGYENSDESIFQCEFEIVNTNLIRVTFMPGTSIGTATLVVGTQDASKSITFEVVNQGETNSSTTDNISNLENASLSISTSTVSLNGEAMECYITINGVSDYDLIYRNFYCESLNTNVADVEIGGWDNNTVTLIIHPVGEGNTSIYVALCNTTLEENINVENYIEGGVEEQSSWPSAIVSTTYIYLDTTPQTCYVTVSGVEKGNYPMVVIDYPSVVSYEWGEWNGDTIEIIFYPLNSGQAKVSIFYEGSIFGTSDIRIDNVTPPEGLSSSANIYGINLSLSSATTANSPTIYYGRNIPDYTNLVFNVVDSTIVDYEITAELADMVYVELIPLAVGTTQIEVYAEGTDGYLVWDITVSE